MAQEKNLETKIKKFLTKQGIYHFKTKGSMFGKIGLPDLILNFNGRFVAIELKSKKGKASLEQLKNGYKIAENNGIFAIIDDFKNFLEFYQDIAMNRTQIRHSLSYEELKETYKELQDKTINKEKIKEEKTQKEKENKKKKIENLKLIKNKVG